MLGTPKNTDILPVEKEGKKKAHILCNIVNSNRPIDSNAKNSTSDIR